LFFLFFVFVCQPWHILAFFRWMVGSKSCCKGMLDLGIGDWVKISQEAQYRTTQTNLLLVKDCLLGFSGKSKEGPPGKKTLTSNWHNGGHHHLATRGSLDFNRTSPRTHTHWRLGSFCGGLLIDLVLALRSPEWLRP
jgi:hypothetical protein